MCLLLSRKTDRSVYTAAARPPLTQHRLLERHPPELRLRAFGAEVVLYDRANEDRDEIGAKLSSERGLTLIKPFDEPLPPGEGDTQAMAVNTTDGSVQYDVAMAMVWVEDGAEQHPALAT